MKTPREILLERHREAQSKLDAIRREALAPMEKNKREESSLSLRDLLRSLRWHLTGMSAVWLFVLLLRLNTGTEPQIVASIPPEKIPSPQMIMVSLRENRRQLAEMIEARSVANAPHELFLPKPRSEWRGETLTA